MLEQGLTVMLSGIGVVFSFLVILVFAMFIMSAVMKKINEMFPVAQAAAPAKKANVNVVSDEIVAAIAVALSKK